MSDKRTLFTIFIIVLAIAGGLGYPVGAGVIRVDVGPTATATSTHIPIPTQTPLPTYTPPATSTPTATPTPSPSPSATPTATETATPEPTWTRQPTYTPAPTYTPGPDPKQMFYDGIDAMCRASNGMTLDLFFVMPWDCYDVVNGGRGMGWYEDSTFHKTATPMPTRRPTPTPTIYHPSNPSKGPIDGSA